MDIETWQRAQLLLEGENSVARRGRTPIGLLLPQAHASLRALRRDDAAAPTARAHDDRCARRHRLTVNACAMPDLPGELIDAAVIDHFQKVGLSIEDTCRDFALVHDRQLREARLLREQSERAAQQAIERIERIKRDYKDGKLTVAEWHEFRDELEPERDAALAEATQHAERERELASSRAVEDAEAEVLQRLAEIRAAIAHDVASQESLQSIRAVPALLTLFSGFTVHRTADGDGEGLPALIHADLMLPGYGLIVEPHVRPEAIAARAELGNAVELHRVPLALAGNIESAIPRRSSSVG